MCSHRLELTLRRQRLHNCRVRRHELLMWWMPHQVKLLHFTIDVRSPSLCIRCSITYIGHALFQCAFLISLLVSTSGGCVIHVRLLHFTTNLRSPSLCIHYSSTCIGHALFLCAFLIYLLVSTSTHETIHKRSWNSSLSNGFLTS